MPDYVSVVIFLGGLSLFVVSLIVVRDYLRGREHSAKNWELMQRAMQASRFEPEEREREFAAIQNEFRILIEGTAGAKPKRSEGKSPQPLGR